MFLWKSEIKMIHGKHSFLKIFLKKFIPNIGISFPTYDSWEIKNSLHQKCV